MTKNAKLHEGHFSRTRKKVIQGSRDPVDHLEVILQMAFRRVDTNELARELLRKFGSYEKLVESATIEELEQVCGIGESSAEKILAILCVMKMYRDMQIFEPFPIDATYSYTIERILDRYFKNSEQELAVLFLLNKKREVIFHSIISRGDENHVIIDNNSILELAKRYRAPNVVLVHNHINESFFPSVEDISMTTALYKDLHEHGINLLDHVIYSKMGNFSFTASLILPAIENRVREQADRLKRL